MNETLDKFYGETGETGESVFIHFWFKIFCVSNGCLKFLNECPYFDYCHLYFSHPTMVCAPMHN